MGNGQDVRRCRCGTRLARDNRGTACAKCLKVARSQRVQPPAVPPEFWQNEEMRAAVATRDMGQVMRAFRQHPFHGRDVPQEVAAGWVGVSQSRLSRIENGEPLTDLAKLVRWAHQLGIPNDLRWFTGPDPQPASDALPRADRRSPAAPTPNGCVLLPVLAGGRSVLVPIRAESIAGDGPAAELRPVVTTASEWDRMSPLDRRALLTRGIAVSALSALGLGELEHVAVALSDSRRYLDRSVVAYFRRQLGACMNDDGVYGATRTLPAVRGLLATIEHSAHDVQPNIRRELLTVAASGAEFVGWLYRDSGDSIRAGTWYDRATAWAQEAGNLPMQGYILLRKSQMAYDDRDATRVLTLAQAAQRGPWQLSLPIRAEVTQQEARGLAMTGESVAVVERKLDDARQLLTSGTGSGDRSDRDCTTLREDTLALRTASCYIEAGKPRQAVELYTQVLSGDLLSRRDRGYFLARMTSALALAGEPDDAASTGLEAMELATATTSQRTKRELGRALATLEPWRGRPGPRQLREALSS